MMNLIFHFPRIELLAIQYKQVKHLINRGVIMSNEISKGRRGALLAVGAAALILAGCAGTGASSSASASKVHCAGVNSCKGTSDCKTAGNECKGHNSCKTAKNACKGQGSCANPANACKGQNACAGHGFTSMSAADCNAKGGHPV
jgi:hypothetical protein